MQVCLPVKQSLRLQAFKTSTQDPYIPAELRQPSPKTGVRLSSRTPQPVGDGINVGVYMLVLAIRFLAQPCDQGTMRDVMTMNFEDWKQVELSVRSDCHCDCPRDGQNLAKPALC